MLRVSKRAGASALLDYLDLTAEWNATVLTIAQPLQVRFK
jgi:hypothetical protein